jgi:hypothetical protein
MFVELGLVISLVLVPLLLGVTVYGLNLIRILQANQLNRDAGHMFARGVDFSGSASGLVNRAILYKMTPALKTATSSGTAVLILSSVQYVGTTSCSSCANVGHVVFLQQIVLGNPSLKASTFGTVPASKMGTDGKVTNPLDDTGVRADGVLKYLNMSAAIMGDGNTAFIAETYLSSADLTIPGFPTPAGTAARAFF